jgi:ornithine cyclodeaminase/alanine dehydrogenase-like protein (mu-crystallin family)
MTVATSPLRYLSAADVAAALPPLETQLDLVARALRALATGEAEMPPKIGVHPREGALIHAMPAWHRGLDLCGVKWIAAYPGNRALGLPAINGLIVLSDAATGVPRGIVEAGLITAIRTAAVSGVAVRLLAPSSVHRIALLGAGVEARSHLPVLTALRPGAEVVVHDRHPERAEALAAEARQRSEVASARAAATAAEAVAGADVVVSVATLSRDQGLDPAWLSSAAVLVAIDFATYASAETARRAPIFAVDDRAQFLAYRDTGYFDGYPDPTTTLGELLAAEERGELREPDRGAPPALVSHLGVGLADVLVADAVLREAERRGLGVELPR